MSTLVVFLLMTIHGINIVSGLVPFNNSATPTSAPLTTETLGSGLSCHYGLLQKAVGPDLTTQTSDLTNLTTQTSDLTNLTTQHCYTHQTLCLTSHNSDSTTWFSCHDPTSQEGNFNQTEGCMDWAYCRDQGGDEETQECTLSQVCTCSESMCNTFSEFTTTSTTEPTTLITTEPTSTMKTEPITTTLTTKTLDPTTTNITEPTTTTTAEPITSTTTKPTTTTSTEQTTTKTAEPTTMITTEAITASEPTTNATWPSGVFCYSGQYPHYEASRCDKNETSCSYFLNMTDGVEVLDCYNSSANLGHLYTSGCYQDQDLVATSGNSHHGKFCVCDGEKNDLCNGDY